MPIWQTDTGGCWCCHPSAADPWLRWAGACISQHRSTSCEQAAARWTGRVRPSQRCRPGGRRRRQLCQRPSLPGRNQTGHGWAAWGSNPEPADSKTGLSRLRACWTSLS